MSLFVLGLLVSGGVALAGAVYQSIGLARDSRRFLPPGRLVEAGDVRLHAVCRGDGAPTVVFESAIAASSLSWSAVQPGVAGLTATCSYDRAGLGWSPAPRTPRRTLASRVDDLEALLAALASRGPHILVGHSFGTFVCLAYAARHPERVAGLVLLDPPTEWLHMDAHRARLLDGARQLSRLGAVLARLGVVRACLALLTGGAPEAPRRFVTIFGPAVASTLERLVGEVQKLPRETHPIVQALWCQPKCFQAMAEHLGSFRDATVQMTRLAPVAIPLTVISSGDQPADVMAQHQALLARSSRGRHLVARSGHWVQFDEPGLVVDAVSEMIGSGRRAQTAPPQ